MAPIGVSAPHLLGVTQQPTSRAGLNYLGSLLANHPSWRGAPGPFNPFNRTGTPRPTPNRAVRPPGSPTPGLAPRPTTPQPSPAQPSPLDSTYFLNTEGENAKVGNQIAGIQQKEGYANTDLQRALAQVTQNKALQERGAQEKANSQGLLSSTALGTNLGAIGQSAADRSAALNANNQRQLAAMNEQISGLRGDQQLYDQAQYLAAAGRQAAADAANKALGMPTAPVTPTAAAPTPGRLAPRGFHYAGHSGRFVLPPGARGKLVRNGGR